MLAGTDTVRGLDRTFVVHIDIPGVDPATLEMTVEQNMLTVTGERNLPRVEDDEVGRRRGSTRHVLFSRRLLLGETRDTDRIATSYDEGVLTITVPVIETLEFPHVTAAVGREPQLVAATAAVWRSERGFGASRHHRVSTLLDRGRGWRRWRRAAIIGVDGGVCIR